MMTPRELGQASAYAKFAELGALAKGVLEHAGIGAATGGTMGGLTGAIAAPSGQRLEGASKGALIGGLAGGALGAGGRALAGNVEDAALRRAQPSMFHNPMQAGPASEQQVEEMLARMTRGQRGLSGIAGGLSGGVAGAAAAPNEPTLMEKLKARLGLG
jgi:hypothetical protein